MDSSSKIKTHLNYYTGQLSIPIIGYGTWLASNPTEFEAALEKALEVGYRHFDTAYMYGNETILGQVLNRWLSAPSSDPPRQRSELFITTKCPIQGCHPARVEKFLDLSLSALQLDYVDLYLIHNPAAVSVDPNNGLDVGFEPNGQVILDTSAILEETWTAMEAQVMTGKTKAIGLSNVGVSQIERIAKYGLIKPAVVQVELNAAYPKRAIRKVCKKHGIVVTAFAPLGSPGRADPNSVMSTMYFGNENLKVPQLLDNPTVMDIGKKYNKSPAQILLKFLIQNEIVVIPKSITPARIAENFQLFDFVLDRQSLKELSKLDSGQSGTWGWDWINAFPGLDQHPEFQQDVLPLQQQQPSE